jgi:hydrogenase expression/formation protein HypE
MSKERIFPLGKLDMNYLGALLNRYTHRDPRVVVGAQIGEDAAVIDFGDRYLVAKTDPITFATDQIGWYVVQVNANDLATTGATPRWLLVTILLPEGRTTEALVERIFQQLHDACSHSQIALVGGHTEVTYELDRPIVVGQLLGEVAKDKLVRTGGAQMGDDVILTKGIAIEGTSIIARERATDLSQRGYTVDWLARAQNYLFSPGISVLRDAQVAAANVPIHAMHDPTEGGIATGLNELACAAGVGLLIEQERIPVLSECAELCALYHLDPLGLIASGALLLTVPVQATPLLLEAYRKAGISASIIGKVVSAAEGIKIKSGESVIDLRRFDQDEITKLF